MSCPFPLRYFSGRGTSIKENVLQLVSRIAMMKMTRNGGDTVPLLGREPTRRNDQPTDRAASVLNDERMRTFIPILLRLLVIRRCHADVSCQSGVPQTLDMPERFYFIDMKSVCAFMKSLLLQMSRGEVSPHVVCSLAHDQHSASRWSWRVNLVRLLWLITDYDRRKLMVHFAYRGPF